MSMEEGSRKAGLLLFITMTVIVAFLVALALWPSNCSAETPPVVPEDQWNAEVKLWLAHKTCKDRQGSQKLEGGSGVPRDYNPE